MGHRGRVRGQRARRAQLPAPPARTPGRAGAVGRGPRARAHGHGRRGPRRQPRRRAGRRARRQPAGRGRRRRGRGGIAVDGRRRAPPDRAVPGPGRHRRGGRGHGHRHERQRCRLRAPVRSLAPAPPARRLEPGVAGRRVRGRAARRGRRLGDLAAAGGRRRHRRHGAHGRITPGGGRPPRRGTPHARGRRGPPHPEHGHPGPRRRAARPARPPPRPVGGAAPRRAGRRHPGGRRHRGWAVRLVGGATRTPGFRPRGRRPGLRRLHGRHAGGPADRRPPHRPARGCRRPPRRDDARRRGPGGGGRGRPPGRVRRRPRGGRPGCGRAVPPRSSRPRPRRPGWHPGPGRPSCRWPRGWDSWSNRS